MHQSIQNYKYPHWQFGKMVLSVYPFLYHSSWAKVQSLSKKHLRSASERRPSLRTQRTFRLSFKQDLILKFHDLTHFEFDSFITITIISITQTWIFSVSVTTSLYFSNSDWFVGIDGLRQPLITVSIGSDPHTDTNSDIRVGTVAPLSSDMLAESSRCARGFIKWYSSLNTVLGQDDDVLEKEGKHVQQWL